MLAVAEHAEVKLDFIPRIATGFCSGMARTAGMCGAVSGGVMAISLILGRDDPEDSVDPCYQAVRDFLDAFKAKFDTTSCFELTGVHLGTPEGQEAFRARGREPFCAEYVGQATGMVVDILDRELAAGN